MKSCRNAFTILFLAWSVLAASTAARADANWFSSDTWSINIDAINYYEVNATNLIFLGQKETIKSSWPGLEPKLSSQAGFFRVGGIIVNSKNIAAVHRNVGPNGSTIYFKDGRELNVEKFDGFNPQ